MGIRLWHRKDDRRRTNVYLILQGRRNRSGRPGGCRTNNLTKKIFYVHIILTFMNVN